MQTVTVTLPGEGSDELMGVQFVVRKADGSHWYKVGPCTRPLFGST